VNDYLPDPKPILRVPRSFVLDVRLVIRTGGQIVRTLAPADFARFVANNIATRQEKIIEKSNQAVEMLPMFAERMSHSHLMSRKLIAAHERSQEGPRAQRLEAHGEETARKGGAGGV